MDITHIAVSDIHLRLPLGMATITDRYVNLFVNSFMINGLNRLPTLVYNKFFQTARFYKIDNFAFQPTRNSRCKFVQKIVSKFEPKLAE